MQRISCYTLFDITKTGVLNRSRPGVDVTDATTWIKQRNTQCNFDTILQVISLRAQPEVVSEPKRILINLSDKHHFGSMLTESEPIPAWRFDFEVYHSSVFEDGISDLGALYKDCEDVPMISCDTHWAKLSERLDTTLEKRNIYFVKYEYD
jgi:hypothetical protein